MNKNDKRYIHTEEKIRNAYTLLCKHNQPKNISVSDICKEAHINRSSFYLHYLNVDALIDSIEEDAFHEILKIVHKYHYDKDMKEIISHLFEEMNTHRDILEYAIYCSKDSADKFREIVFNISSREWKKLSNLSTEDMELIYYYLSSATVAILKKWIEQGYPSYQKYADLLANLLSDGLHYYIKNNE